MEMAETVANVRLRLDRETVDRIHRALMIAHEPLLVLTSILKRTGISHSVIGGHAVAHWVPTEELAAVRTTPIPNMLVRGQHVSESRGCVSRQRRDEHGRKRPHRV